MTDPIKLTTAAQMQEANKAATLQEDVHAVLSELSLRDMLFAVYAHIEARPDLEPNGDPLMEFSNRVGRLAWKHI